MAESISFYPLDMGKILKRAPLYFVDHGKGEIWIQTCEWENPLPFPIIAIVIHDHK